MTFFNINIFCFILNFKKKYENKTCLIKQYNYLKKMYTYTGCSDTCSDTCTFLFKDVD